MGRRGTILGLLALFAAVVAAWGVLRDEGNGRSRPGPVPHRDVARGIAPPPVVLRGHPDADRTPTSTPAAPPEKIDLAAPLPAAPPELEALAAQPIAANAERWTKNGPRSPTRPHHPDPALGDPFRRVRVARHDLLGRPVTGTGPWLPDGREWVFDGVVEVTTDGEETGTERREDETDEIEEPLMTAVTGRVVSAGAPVPGAVVILYSTFYLRHARYDHHVREVGRTATDDDGRFDLRPIGIDTVHFGADGEVLLTIHREGLGSIVAKRIDNLQPEQENDLGVFSMSPTATSLSGTILDWEGEPVVGAAVRVSGHMNPVLYDKTERMVVLKDCPTAVTDPGGTYRLDGFAPGRQSVSIHVNIDCVLRLDTTYTEGAHAWSPRVRAGHSVTGRVIDANGDAVAKAVVSGGGNWTPTNPDGTFWLDNIDEGPFALEVTHHAFCSVALSGIVADTEDTVEIRMVDPLPRIRLRVTAEETGASIPIVAIDWTWTGGGAPRFVPVSPFWHARDGVVEVIVPENAARALVSSGGRVPVVLEARQLANGLEHGIALALKAPGED